MGFWIIFGIIAVIGLFLITLYNRLVALRQNRANAFADIDVQLKQRFNLVPALVETVKGYASHEKGVFDNVTKMRSKIKEARTETDRIQAEAGLGNALINLHAVAENYPDLKADQNFQQLMAELSDIENKIAAARRFFNNATNEFNTAIQQFPANLIARQFGFQTAEFFDVTENERDILEKAPDIKFGT